MLHGILKSWLPDQGAAYPMKEFDFEPSWDTVGSLRHQFDASRVSFKELGGLQLSKYVIFIYLDLFSLGNAMDIDRTPSPT